MIAKLTLMVNLIVKRDIEGSIAELAKYIKLFEYDVTNNEHPWTWIGPVT